MPFKDYRFMPPIDRHLNVMGDSVKMAAIGGARMGYSLATLGKMCALLCGRFIS